MRYTIFCKFPKASKLLEKREKDMIVKQHMIRTDTVGIGRTALVEQFDQGFQRLSIYKTDRVIL